MGGKERGGGLSSKKKKGLPLPLGQKNYLRGSEGRCARLKGGGKESLALAGKKEKRK